jgi:Asp-tRNA(Asn)/Glu-tRNA(Gln) amidotransferase A subunit family amidase
VFLTTAVSSCKQTPVCTIPTCFRVVLCCCQAAAIDAAIARGEPAGPLAGVPIAIKVKKN